MRNVQKCLYVSNDWESEYSPHSPVVSADRFSPLQHLPLKVLVGQIEVGLGKTNSGKISGLSEVLKQGLVHA